MLKTFVVTKSLMKRYNVASLKELYKKAKDEGADEVEFIANVPVKIKQISQDDNNRFRATLSTPTLDRDNEIVYQNFVLDYFKTNPVLLDTHNDSSITNILGSVEDIGVDNGNLTGDLVFALMNPKGKLARDMVAAGHLRAISIRFAPIDFDAQFNFLKSELYEVSLVPVPSNRFSMVEKDTEKGEKKNAEGEGEKENKEPTETEEEKEKIAAPADQEPKENDSEEASQTEHEPDTNEEEQTNDEPEQETEAETEPNQEEEGTEQVEKSIDVNAAVKEFADNRRAILKSIVGAAVAMREMNHEKPVEEKRLVNQAIRELLKSIKN